MRTTKRPHRFGLGQASGSSGTRRLLKRRRGEKCPHVLARCDDKGLVCDTCGRKLYEVLTWDRDAQAFTPQIGVPRGPYTLWELKAALRKLQSMGYPCDRSHRDGETHSDPSVLVRRVQTGGWS